MAANEYPMRHTSSLRANEKAGRSRLKSAAVVLTIRSPCQAEIEPEIRLPLGVTEKVARETNILAVPPYARPSEGVEPEIVDARDSKTCAETASEEPFAVLSIGYGTRHAPAKRVYIPEDPLNQNAPKTAVRRAFE